VDFPSYYFAARATLNEGIIPYEQASLRAVATQDDKSAPAVLPFLYLPPSLILFYPFTKLDYEAARRSMLIINLILVFVLSYGILNILEEKLGSWFSLFVLGYMVLFAPLAITIDYGQVNMIVITLICGAWYLTKSRHAPIWPAILLALSIILKLYPILLIIPLWLRREYKVVYLTLIMLAVLTAATWLILPGGIWSSWYTNVGSTGYGREVLRVPLTIPANQSIYGFLARAFYGHNVRFAPILSLPGWLTARAPYVAAGLVMLVSTAVSHLARNGNTFDIDLSYWLVVSYLIAPISWYHHMVFALPAILVLLHYLLRTRINVKTIILVFVTALFWLFNYPANSQLFREGIKTLLISVPFYMIFLLWIFLTLTLLYFRRKEPKIKSAQ